MYGSFLLKFLSRWLSSLLVGLVHLWTDQRIPGPVSCRCPGRFVGDHASLARNNIVVSNSNSRLADPKKEAY